jgi:transcriptional regulator with XRE-family HTH domain
MGIYHYTECGLDNVFIEGMNIVEDHSGEATVEIKGIGYLHKVIAEGIVMQPSKMSGSELRFLRTEMGMTQSKLAEILKCSMLTVGRWERDEKPISDTAEMLTRLMSIEKLSLSVVLDVGSVSEKVTQEPRIDRIWVDGSDPEHYHLLPAAA